MNDLNQCTMTGRLGADPEIRRTQDGKPIVNLRLAVSSQWRDSAGERKERTTWVPVVVFNEGLVKVCEQYLKRGSRVLVQGAFTTRKWQDQQGQDRYATEIVLQGYDAKIVMLDGLERGEREEKPEPRRQETRASRPVIDPDLDDSIPF